MIKRILFTLIVSTFSLATETQPIIADSLFATNGLPVVPEPGNAIAADFLLQTDGNGSGTVSSDEIADGVYLYIVSGKNGLVATGTLVKQWNLNAKYRRASGLKQNVDFRAFALAFCAFDGE